MNKTRIPWAEWVWNPIAGCQKISPGCDNCYAARLASTRLAHQKDYAGLALNGEWSGKVRSLPHKLDEPLHHRKPATIFTCSMSDLFQKNIPFEFIDRVFAIMGLASWHTFIILTKRAERMRDYILSRCEPLSANWQLNAILTNADSKSSTPKLNKPLPNVWLGVTVESDRHYNRIDYLLLQTPATKRFISYEPALGPVNNIDEYLNIRRIVCQQKYQEKAYISGDDLCVEPKQPREFSRIDWVIVGGETGPGARECREEWVQAVYDQCQTAGVPFFFKSHGSKWTSGCEGKHCPTCMEAGEDVYCDETDWKKRREWPK